MKRYITVTLNSMSVTEDPLGNTTEVPTSAEYDRVRFVPRSSNESVDSRAPRVYTAASLFRRGEFPVDEDDTVEIVNQHPLIDGTWRVEGEVGRWASGVEVALQRAGGV